VSNRRSTERVPFVAGVRKQVGREVHLALAQNLAPAGMKLWRARTLARYPVDTPVELCFALDGELIYASATIVFERVEGSYHSTGVRFVNLSEDDRKRIAEFTGADMPTPASMASPRKGRRGLHVVAGLVACGLGGLAYRTATMPQPSFAPPVQAAIIPRAAPPPAIEAPKLEAPLVSEKPRKGQLRIAVQPWAEVSVDGASVGMTPLSPIRLHEGSHLVELKNGELGVSRKKRVVIAPSRETRLAVNLFE
jgi:hypothetical protein